MSIVAVRTQLTLELHTGLKEAMGLFSAGATKLRLNDVLFPKQDFSYFFTCLIALHFLLSNVEVRSKESLTSSEEKEANSSAILSIFNTRATNSSRESLTESKQVLLMNDIDGTIDSYVC